VDSFYIQYGWTVIITILKQLKMYTQNVLSAPAKILVGTKTTKSGQVKNIYRVNPDSHVIKQIRHNTPKVFK